MSSSCERIHELLTAEAAGVEPWSEQVEAHVRGCEACAAWAGRLRLHRRALSELRPVEAPRELEERIRRVFDPRERERRAVAGLAALRRLPVPAELDGRVVAAPHGGFRQDRAAVEVSLLDGVKAPEALDRQMETVFSSLRRDGLLPASAVPRELEERLDHDLRDLPATLSRRFTRKLSRLRAPGILSRRVDDDLRRDPGGRTPISRRWAMAAGIAAAASLALWVGWKGPVDSPAIPGAVPYEIIRVDDLSGLSPQAAAFASAFLDAPAELLPPSQEASRREVEMAEPPVGSSSSGGEVDGRGSGQPDETSSSGGASRPDASASSSPSTVQPTPPAGSRGPSTTPPFLDLVPDAPFVTAYRGERLVACLVGIDPVALFETRELVASDGREEFAVELLEVIHPQLSPGQLEEYALLQSDRAGFSYRHRDFRIRDLERFWSNYQVVDTGAEAEVAGRPCAVLDVSRVDGLGNDFRIWVDTPTGLLMKQLETRPDGRLVRRTEFESFQLDADLSDLELNVGPTRWIDFDPYEPEGLGFDLLLPSAPPSGFSFVSSSLWGGPLDPSGASWVRLIYGDGAEQVFFLHSDAGLRPDSPPIVGPTDDFVRIFSAGAWTVADSLVRGRHVISIGKVDEQELLLMIQSALE